MKRQVLFIGFDDAYQSEIVEFLKERDGQAWFSDSTDRSIRMLEEQAMDTVVLNMRKLVDAAILKYLNQYYPDIKILISTSDEFENIINVLTHSSYHLLRQPFKLKELNMLL